MSYFFLKEQHQIYIIKSLSISHWFNNTTNGVTQRSHPHKNLAIYYVFFLLLLPLFLRTIAAAMYTCVYQYILIFACLPIYLSVSLYYVSICLSVCLFILSTHLSLCLSIFLSVYTSTYVYTHLSVYLLHLSIFLSLYLFIDRQIEADEQIEKLINRYRDRWIDTEKYEQI